MTPACHIALAIVLAAPVGAQPSPDPPAPDPHIADAARTVALNAAARQREEAIAAKNAVAAAAYAAELDRFHAAQARNDRDRATADAAADTYRRDRAGYEAAMARWQARTGALAAARRPAPDPPARPGSRIVCEDVASTGTAIKRRVCHAD